MFLVCCREVPGAVAGCIWVEYPHIKVRILTTSPETSGPNARMSSRAPSSVLAEASRKASPDSGCRCGSVATLEQTSVSSEAVMSLTSLWRMVGNPPHVANHGMVGGECLAAVTLPGNVLEIPPISQTKGISEFSLVQMEALV